MTTQPKVWQDWLAGLHFIMKNSVVSVIFVVMALAGIAEGVFNVMFVIFIRQKLGGEALEFGWLTSAQAIGGLIGGLLIGWLGNRIHANRLTGLLALNGILILILANLPSLPVALVALLLAGIPIVGFSVGVDTLLQRYVADRYRGRVFGALGTSMSIFMLIGQGLSSLFGDRLGPGLLLDLKGFFDITAGLLAFFLLYHLTDVQLELEADKTTF